MTSFWPHMTSVYISEGAWQPARKIFWRQNSWSSNLWSNALRGGGLLPLTSHWSASILVITWPVKMFNPNHVPKHKSMNSWNSKEYSNQQWIYKYFSFLFYHIICYIVRNNIPLMFRCTFDDFCFHIEWIFCNLLPNFQRNNITNGR